MLQFLLLAVGLIIIIKSADVLIDSSSRIARRYGVSTFIIGITVVAFGTSAPELAVGVLSGIQHANRLTLGNVIGSGLSNLSLNIGLAAMLLPLAVKDSVVKREIPMLLAVEAALCAMLFLDGQLSRVEGVLLLAGFAAFMVYIIKSSGSSMQIQLDIEGDIDTDADGNGMPQAVTDQPNMGKLWLYSILSLVGLFAGGQLTVSSSADIARSLGLSETLIGLTVVALATTMPEIITSIMAVRKKEPEIVLGNCIGSNIFNILLILGVSSAISPISVDAGLWIDAAAMVANTVFVLVVSVAHRQVRRPAGIVLVVAYVGYLVFKVVTVVM